MKLEWDQDPTKSSIKLSDPTARVLAGERSFLGQLARLGHGMQRSFLVAILQELASAYGNGGPTLLLAVEEPELYQHPPQARRFANLLKQLSDENAQTIVTTHSPYFISGRDFEAVRMVRPREKESFVRQLSYEGLAQSLEEALGHKAQTPTSVMARLEQILQPSQAEMFFTNVPILVEGQEDVAFISTRLDLSGKLDEFRSLGCHFVVAGGKTNLSRLLAIALGLEMPAFLVFDADGNKNKPAERIEHERNNRCLLRLCGHSQEDPFPATPLWKPALTVWPDNIKGSVTEELGEAWSEARSRAREKHNLMGVDEKKTLLISACLEELAASGRVSNVLDRVCDQILRFARQASG